MRLSVSGLPQSDNPGPLLFKLHPTFQEKLKIALVTGETPEWAHNEMKPDKKAPSVDNLHKYTQKQWESLLEFLVGSEGTYLPPNNIVDVLIKTGILAQTQAQSYELTNNGYQFLLRDPFSQIWTLMTAYVDSAEDRSLSKVEVLTFLFQLSFLTFGKDYPITKLTTNQKAIIEDLRAIGAIYHRKEKSRRFYPTKLALILSLSSHSSRDIIETGANDGYVVMDPNFRVYGYTSSNLQATILGLFCKISYRLPNLVVGALTRESIHEALQNGITSKEIITYLTAHAHPEMRKDDPVVPESLVDQIRLWEGEKNCLGWKSGTLFENFDAKTEVKLFEDTVLFAKSKGIFVWESKQPMRLFVAGEIGHEMVRQFIKEKNSLKEKK